MTMNDKRTIALKPKKRRNARTARGAWVVVARIPQMGGAVREVLVERRHAREVREVLREDPARIDRLWCPVRTREV